MIKSSYHPLLHEASPTTHGKSPKCGNRKSTTYSGKSTFIQWIAGDNTKLIANEVKEGTGEYIIEDNDRIGDSTINSKTIFPELVVEKKTNSAYYDCPGFNDTRSTNYDIATTYFIKKILNHAERVKMILIINHPSVKKCIDRQDFMSLIKHVTDLVKDCNKFKNSIAVVATKVDNHYIKRESSFVLVEDDKIIEGIADFLWEVRQDLEKLTNNPGISANEKQFLDNAINLIDTLLVKDGNHYAKIGIFRRPDKSGQVNDISLLQAGKKTTIDLLNENLNFTSKYEEDFGYTISEKSKNEINALVEEINQIIWSNVSNIVLKIDEKFQCVVGQLRNKIKSFISNTNLLNRDQLETRILFSEFEKGCEAIFNMVGEIRVLKNPETLARKMDNIITSLGIDISKEKVIRISNGGKYVSFLQVVSDKELSMRPWVDLFKNTLTFISESKKNIRDDINEAAEKIDTRMLSELEAIAKFMQEQYIEKMKQLEIQELPDILGTQNNAILNFIEKIQTLTTPSEFLTAIQNISNCIRIDMPKENMSNVKIFGECLEFLQIISGEEPNIGSSTWAHPFKNLAKDLNESEKWYRFLWDLYIKFSQFEIQKDRHRYNVANIDDWGETEKAQGIAITASNFEQFLSKIANYNIKEYHNVKNIAVNGLKLDELNHVLTLTLKHKIDIRCKYSEILVTGDYISIEELMTVELKRDKYKDYPSLLKSGKYKFINIFALNTIFIDYDVSFKGLELPVICVAPKWKVVGTKRIDLNGTDGEPYCEPKARDGTSPGCAGEDGQPGRPGGPGGIFWGIGEIFENGANLTISANGGRGGPGQNGGNGSKGYDGSTPTNLNFTCESDYKTISGFKCELITYHVLPGRTVGIGACREYIPDRGHCRYRIFGTYGGKGGNGGHGGKRGKGGYPGNIQILELNGDSKILKVFREGRDGENGKEGTGGNGGRNGDDIVAEYVINSKGYTVVERRNNGRRLPGNSGKNGSNDKGIESPQKPVLKKELVDLITVFENCSVKNLTDRFKKCTLNTFLKHLNRTKYVLTF
ncbi:uncharacterized protein TNIN_126211 [Trichonephila inaurata madagascariensis]|uniref:Uncharacterized protein n=1 Tax=Trichonephila inaurata madagascariensis TaxID=2747483 RepID=A0A8X6WSD8_9ARAC|nr:uncharacterized protein TNIN_126211 [Trichonephila inaurata madagascariensis]